MIESAHCQCTKIPPWERRDTTVLVMLVLIFVATRLVWIWLNPATASYWEESYRWLAAHEILNGMTRPLLDYQADHYQGGSLFMILLAVPFFWLVGESALSLKLAALLFSTVTLIVLFALGRCFFGRTVAVLAGLAYLAGPPLVAFWGLVLMGFHSESTLFSLLQVFTLLGLLTGQWRHLVGWLAFGMVCGAGFSFTYITVLSAAACAITWLILEGSPRWKELGLAALGFVVGLIPWIAYNATHGFAGLARIAEVFGLRDAPDLWRVQGFGQRLVDLLVRVPIHGLLDPSENALGSGARVLLAVGFLAPICLALIFAAYRMGCLLRSRLRWSGEPADELSRRELVFGVYAVLFLLAYLSSRFTLDPSPAPVTYRLFPPLVVLLMIPVAISAQRMIIAGGALRRFSQVACAICLVSTATATFAYANRPPDPGAELSLLQGYTVFGRLLHRKFAVLSAAVAGARPVANTFRRDLILGGIGWEAQSRFEVKGDYQQLLANFRTVPEAERIPLLSGLLWGANDRIRVLSDRTNPDPRDIEDLERMRELTRIVEPLLARLKEQQGG